MTDETQSATVLIVEDEQSLADLYAQFLETAYNVRTAYDGEEALASMSDEVDVVLLDRRMPSLSGREVLEAIRETGYDCRVAMVTAITPDVDIIEMGFDDYLTKPVEREDLLETVGSLLELVAYDDLMQEYYQLTSKKVALETVSAGVEFSEREEYTEMVERLDVIEGDLRARQDAEKFDFRSLVGRSDTAER